MTSKIVVNNIEADSGISTVTFNSNIQGNLIGDVTGNVNSTGVTTVTSLRIGTGASISSPATNVLTLGTNNVERVRIDSNGLVGIGTTNPTVALQLSPDASISNVNVNNPLSSVAGAALTVAQFVHTNANGSYLRIKATRLSNGSSWTTASTKIVQVTDVTEQSYIEFNPSGGNYGMAFGGYNDTNGLTEERLRIDSRGRVTMPYQPYARSSSTSLVSSGNAIPLNSYNLSRGGITISGNRFTVPVAGAYVFGYHHLGNSGSGACQVEIRHNGTYVSGTRTQDTNSSNDSFGTQTVKELAASDYIEFWVIQGTTHNNTDYNSMWIWLIG